MRQSKAWSLCLQLALGSTLASAIGLIPQESVAANISVNINSTPQGAMVRLDSQTAPPIGTTPLRATRIPGGVHTLYFQLAGYVPSRLDINVRRRSETFTAILTQSGSIYVASDTEGAAVMLDGQQVGTTPFRINDVQPGPHIVTVRKDNLTPYNETVTVVGGQVATINARLAPPTPAAPTTGTVRVIVTNPNGPNPADLSVLLDGAPLPGSPPSSETVQPGTHILQISAGGFESIRRELTVTAGQLTALAIDLVPRAPVPQVGTLRVITHTDGAQVFVDGEAMTGSTRTDVPSGIHSIRITAPGRNPYIRENVAITTGQTTTVEINDSDLGMAAQFGRVSVHANIQGASVQVDNGAPVPAPYDDDRVPAGDHTITVRATGYADLVVRCQVGPQRPCEQNVSLQALAALSVTLQRRINGVATLFVDDKAYGEVADGRTVNGLPPGTHRVRISATGYRDVEKDVNFVSGQTENLSVTMPRIKTGNEPSLRRATASTWGAVPLSAGDGALDFYATGGGYYGNLRGTIGILRPSTIGGNTPFGLDAGFALQTTGWLWQVDGRLRFGVRPAGGPFAIGAEAHAFGSLGINGNGGGGGSAFLVMSLHSLVATGDEEEDPETTEQRSRSPVGVVFHLRLGIEGWSDSLTGTFFGKVNGSNLENVRFPTCGVNTSAMGMSSCSNAPWQAGNMQVLETRGMMNDELWVKNGSQSMARGILGLGFEITLSRNVNLFAALERVLTTNAFAQRAIFQGSYGGNDILTYISAGLTYKF